MQAIRSLLVARGANPADPAGTRRRPLLFASLALVALACAEAGDRRDTEPAAGAGGSSGAQSAGSGGGAGTQSAGAGGGGAPNAGITAGGASMTAGGAGAPEETPFDPPASGYAELNLYAGDPPNYLASAPPESVDAASGLIRDVSIPTIRRYPVDASKSNGVAFIAFPGGGYNVLDMERQATALAARLGPLGISVFGLKSRVGAGSNDVRRDALLDAERALRLLRHHATAWRLDPNRIGTVSWSAGSHLALTLAGQFDSGEASSSDAVEQASSRPDFMAVMCPSADGQPTSPFTFTATTPPIYLCHTRDDADAPLAIAEEVEQQLQAVGSLEHLEVYETGGHHAFNVGDTTATVRDWPDKYLPWLRDNQLIP